MVVVECPERSSLMQKLERGSVAKEKLQQLLVYTDFELRTTLCSLMEATCVAAMCAFRHDLYMDQWTKVFGRPPADARGLNQDTATGGNYHEQLRVQKARGSEVSKLGDDGKLQITRQSDGKLVVAYNKVSYIKKKGELVAELPVGDSADRFAEEYVGSDTLTKIVWQAQVDSQVAGREGGLAPVVLSCGRWGLIVRKPYLPGKIAKRFGLQVGGDWTVEMRFFEGSGLLCLPPIPREGSRGAERHRNRIAGTPGGRRRDQEKAAQSMGRVPELFPGGQQGVDRDPPHGSKILWQSSDLLGFVFRVRNNGNSSTLLGWRSIAFSCSSNSIGLLFVRLYAQRLLCLALCRLIPRLPARHRKGRLCELRENLRKGSMSQLHHPATKAARGASATTLEQHLHTQYIHSRRCRGESHGGQEV